MSLENWYECLTAASLAVIIGVLLEGYDLYTDYRERGWSPVLPKIGFLVLVMGLAGEVLFQSKIESADTALRIEAEITVARLQTEARKAESQIADAKKETELSRLETARVEASVAWRRIEPYRFQKMVIALSGEQHSVTIAYTENDPEALAFAAQIAQAFDQAPNVFESHKAWSVLPDPRIYSDHVAFGVSIPGPNDGATKVIREAFKIASIQFDTRDVPPSVFRVGAMTTIGGALNTEALIMVGSKQPPF